MMKRDYKFLTERPRTVADAVFRPGRRHLLALAGAGLVLGFFLSATPDDAAATRGERNALIGDTVTESLRLPGLEAASETTPALPLAQAPTAAPLHTALAVPQPEGSATTSPAEALAEEVAPAPDAEDAPLVTEAPSDETVPEQATVEAYDDGDWHHFKVKSGDSLARIFGRAGLSARQVYEVMQTAGAKRLKRILPGETLRMRIDGEGELNELVLEIDPSRSLRVQRTAQGFTASNHERQYEIRTAHATGVIEHSLFLSAQQAGLSDSVTMELAGIFGWDIDMALDLRQGDRFTVIYEQNYLDGEKVGDGEIVAAEFVNRGKSFRAIRYTDSDGNSSYYTPSGLSVRKAFLRTPVDFARISSKFDLRRRHPILNRIRAHKGVDYAAATGTPIKATGDGKIVFRGRKGGYGNTVIIRHGSRYSTLYAHMSRFNSRFKVGSKVRQGQTIGYVGSSGLATGPHLHYEFRVNGVHRNPLTVELPVATPIATLELPAFRAEADPLIAQLDTLARTQVARN